MMLLWAYKTPIHTTQEMAGISQKSIVQWFQYFRDICSWWLVQNLYQIGKMLLTVSHLSQNRTPKQLDLKYFTLRMVS